MNILTSKGEIKIGLVKVDVHKAEKQFQLITFSDVECIKGLIKYRYMIDEYQGADVDRHYDHAGNVKPLNQELIAIYADLDNLLSRCKLNIKQRYIVNRLMEGYTEQQVANIFRQDVRTIERTLDTICNKVKKLNDLDWKYEYAFMNYYRVKWDYKKCTKCEESKPMLSEFFGNDPRNKDGLKSICKECDLYTKNQP